MSKDTPPNYYAILEISDTATQQQVRDAYKRAALKTHPDRVPADSPERPSRTRKFQLVNDAYYALSDPTRRREYDSQRKMFGGSSTSSSYADPFAGFDTETPAGAGAGTNQSQGPYSWAWNFFTGQRQKAEQSETREQHESAQFGDVFEEMLREEGMAEPNGQPTGKFWGMIGGVSGGAMGFIVANVPGMLAGAVAGNRLGAIRDVKGKSVYSVFQELPYTDRARLLSQLAAKVFSHTVGI